MIGRMTVSLMALLALGFVHVVQAQPPKVYRVGVIHEGGPFNAAVDGLRDGLKESGLEVSKNVLLEIRDLKGDRKAAAQAAASLEQGKVDLIYVLATSVTTLVKRATVAVPIVFVVGGDPVVAGLVESYGSRGGRLTGIHYLSTDLTAKRLELLTEIFPKLRRVVSFYDPSSEIASATAKATREAAGRLNVEIIGRHVASVEEIRLATKALDTKDADAYFYIPDGMVLSQAQLIIDTARAKKLPTMFSEPGLAAQGALVGYGVSYYDAGRLSAKYVQRVLAGTSPKNLPVESFSRFTMAVNLKTARELGIIIPQSVLFRADNVIE